VVDNNSADGTPHVVSTFADLRPHLDLRLLKEPRQGVAFARKLGLREARGEWVALVDDDCRLENDWLEEMWDFSRKHPHAGAFGGKNALEWEQPPSDLALAYGDSLARQDWGDAEERMPDTGKRCPCGAGLVLRKEAVYSSGYLEQGRLTGRHPRTLGAGEDTEVQLMIRNAGWELWYAPRLRVRHFIPAHRTSLEYLRRLHRGFGLAEGRLRLLGGRLEPTAENHAAILREARVEFRSVLARFWLGFVRYKNERPTWLIRLSFALGFLRGALRMRMTGRVE
jgi:glycosyltransferase involved in cell wall biosynthesis